MQNKLTLLFIKNAFLITLFVGVCFFIPDITQAAVLSISPNSSSVNVDNIFTVRVSVNTSGKTINNAEAVVQFPKSLLEVVSISKSSSIFSLWVEEPKFSNSVGSVTFNGGLPNPGFNGSSGYIASITFKAKKQGTASVIFADAAIRENDGLGTNILTGTNQASFTILPSKAKVTPEPISTPKEIIIPPIAKVMTPIFTDYTTNVKEGEFIVVKGLADPQTKIIIDSDNSIASREGIVHQSTFISSDDKGKFVYVSENRVEKGIYTITAQAHNQDDIESEKTSPIQISVLTPSLPNNSFLTNLTGSFTIIIPIVGLLILLILLIIWGWHHIWHYREYMNKRLMGTRKIVSKSFDILNEDVLEEIKIFKKIKASQPLTKDEYQIANQLRKDIESAEKVIMSDIKDF